MPGGQCLPGVAKLFITAKGEMLPCEKVIEKEKKNHIGKIGKGFDLEKSRELLNILKINEANCSKCFAIKMCDFCIMQLYNSDSIDDDLNAFCLERKDHFLNQLKISSVFQDILLENYKNYFTKESDYE